jgi:hypothetical protein
LSLTAPERETVITFSDADDMATVHTHQRRIITKLANNSAAKQIEDLTFDGTPRRGVRYPRRPDQLPQQAQHSATDGGAKGRTRQ